MEQTTARLRRQFQYSDDNGSDSDSLPEAIDEEEQERLIASLSSQNAAQNEIYARIFIALPILSSLPYLFLLYAQTSTGSSLLALLALSSMAATAWALWFLPPGVTGLHWLDVWMMGSVSGDGFRDMARPATREDLRGKGRDAQPRVPQLGQELDKGPLELYLPHLNLALVGFCALLAVVIKKEGEEGSWIGLLPGMVYGIICVVKGLMGSVDVEGLQRLRYVWV